MSCLRACHALEVKKDIMGGEMGVVVKYWTVDGNKKKGNHLVCVFYTRTVSD